MEKTKEEKDFAKKYPGSRELDISSERILNNSKLLILDNANINNSSHYAVFVNIGEVTSNELKRIKVDARNTVEGRNHGVILLDELNKQIKHNLLSFLSQKEDEGELGRSLLLVPGQMSTKSTTK